MRSSGVAWVLLGMCVAAGGPSAAEERFPSMPSLQGEMPCGSCKAPAAILSRATIVPASEPGERLVMSGTVYDTDGVTPAPGITIFVYHTDAKGHYNSPDDALNPRLYGWVRTDKDGRYEFRTIRPAPYPQVTTPAHVHVHVYGPGRPEWFIPEYFFEGDALIPARDRDLPVRMGSFSPVVRLSRDGDGAWQGRRDIRLDAPPDASAQRTVNYERGGALPRRAEDASTSKATIDRLTAQADAWDKAIVRKDRAAIVANMADDFRQIDRAGNVETKKSFVDGLMSSELQIDPYTVEDFDVRLYGDTALLSGRTRMTGRYQGQPFASHYRYIDVYVRQGDAWTIVSVQISPIPEKTESR